MSALREITDRCLWSQDSRCGGGGSTRAGNGRRNPVRKMPTLSNTSVTASPATVSTTPTFSCRVGTDGLTAVQAGIGSGEVLGDPLSACHRFGFADVHHRDEFFGAPAGDHGVGGRLLRRRLAKAAGKFLGDRRAELHLGAAHRGRLTSKRQNSPGVAA